jgi:hypothetical protein
MELPEDIEPYVRRTFAAAEWASVVELVASVVIHDGQPAGPRLMRCALLPSGGTIAGLRRQLDQLTRDCRDVIVEGEYAPRAGKPVRIRNLNDPIPKGSS